MKEIKNLFTIRDHDVKMVAKIRGTYEDLGRVLLELHNKFNEKNHLALYIVTQMKNSASDNDVEFDSLDWKDYIHDIADSVLNSNAPFVYKNASQLNMCEYPQELYFFIEKIAKEECEKHFTEKAQESSDTVKLLIKQLNDMNRQLDDISEERAQLDEKENRIRESLGLIDSALTTIKRYEH